ncbi:MAG: ATP-binding protein [Bacillota bacterium]
MVIVDKEIQSTFDAVHEFVIEALDKIHELNIPEIDEVSFKMNIMLREVLNNAVEHGNKFDSEKKVSCKIKYNDRKFIFRIQDEGQGFEIDEFYKMQKGFTMKHRSRGLDLIEKYDFEYEFDGNIIIVKYFLDKER